ncbi:aspartate racemase [Ferroglobus placidus DSM 10642]|uniref:Aspartate racemase n=1 Tax=Ferroglobus placidus (strain DSM 10642 / AEDII12DO) TaxID=589924 RepID=D3S201_FERPA|nr:amino acid racemase [Ferroglobus placidus]ADC64458.1 aspartate racemase [Ferroglobus placidus DSM 10642]
MIGIVGGLSPEATAYYYRLFIEESRKRFPKYFYPEILIYSLNFKEFVEGSSEERKRLLVKALKKLDEAGVKVGGIASNTPHMFFDELKKAVSFELVSIVEAVAEKAGKGKFLLLGTKKTMESDFYQRAFEKYGGEIIVPEEEDREVVHRVIMEELVLGKFEKDKLLEVIKKYERFVDGVVLGCTELPLAISQKDLNVELFDSAKIHVEKMLEVYVDKFINRE